MATALVGTAERRSDNVDVRHAERSHGAVRGYNPLWTDLCAVLESEELPADERFETMHDRFRNADALTELIEAELATNTSFDENFYRPSSATAARTRP